MITYESLSTKFKVRKLSEREIPMILSLLNSNPLYYKHCPPSPTKESICADMRALPPHQIIQNKYYLGFFEGEELISIVDFIVGYPNEKTVFCGFFMVAANQSGKGLGSQIVEECLHTLKEQGFQSVRLAYMKTNPQSKAFWEKCRFLPTGVESNNGQGIVVMMERNLV